MSTGTVVCIVAGGLALAIVAPGVFAMIAGPVAKGVGAKVLAGTVAKGVATKVIAGNAAKVGIAALV